jgi:hypothetical protein
MTKLLDDALEAARNLPPDDQVPTTWAKHSL